MIPIDDKPKEQVYDERNQAALLAAKLADRHSAISEAGYRTTEDEDYPVLTIDHKHLGQMGWHIPREDLPEWLEETDTPYDGHTTEEKHDRMQRWIAALDEDYINWHIVGGTTFGASVAGAVAAGTGGFLVGLIGGAYIGMMASVGHWAFRVRGVYREMDPLPTRVIDSIRKEWS